MAVAGNQRHRREAETEDVMREPTDRSTSADAGSLHAAADSADHRDDMLAQLESVFESDGAREIIETMHGDLPRQLTELDQAVGVGDWVSAARVLHSLKSTVRMVRAEALGQALEDAEKLLLGSDRSIAVSRLPALTGRCRELMNRLLSDLRP